MDALVRFARYALPLALLLTAAVLVPLKVFDSNGLDRVRRLTLELQSIEEANQLIRRENEALRQQIRAFHSDPGYIEKIARDELGLIGPSEVVYQFPDDSEGR
ncbi:MAG TPA: septum formation initiator family protein [Polyangia bacterium]|nr:septum formation initiator family protein [Polyangia bacterium]